MKQLRNKKTGDISTNPLISVAPFTGGVRGCHIKTYRSAAEFNEEWEDVEDINAPSMPLIKDEKIRKAVRAWWETIPDAVTDKRVLYKNNHDFEVGIYSIYCGAIYPDTLEKCRLYTITELCGEDEE